MRNAIHDPLVIYDIPVDEVLHTYNESQLSRISTKEAGTGEGRGILLICWMFLGGTSAY